MNFSDRISSGIILFDGPMGTEIHARDLSPSDYRGHLGCSEILNLSRPDIIEDIHKSYINAGSDAIETNSFGANSIVLAEYGIAEQSREINRLSAEIARQAVERYSQKRCYVIGSVGPGTKLISLGQCEWASMYTSYCEQATGLIEGGVEGFIVETSQDPLQIKCAVLALQDTMQLLQQSLPIMVSFTIETTGTLLVGTELSAVCTTILPLGVDSLGMNCATGPAEMSSYIRQLSELSPLPISVQPNAGLPENRDGKVVYTLSQENYLATMISFIKENGVSIVGGCCGILPQDISALANQIKELTELQVQKQTRPKDGGELRSSVSSLFMSQQLSQDISTFFVGERTNTNGSKKFRELLIEEDWDALVDIAREQAESGVHALDLCLAYTGRNELRDMSETLSRIVRQISLPVVIDSTEIAVMETALQIYGGRAIINSVNLEDGEGRANRICQLARRYGAALIALTIDENGMARSPAQKLKVANRIYDIAVNQNGLCSDDLIFDSLTFTLASGDPSMADSAIHTLEGIRLIKQQFPNSRTILGLSNLSFGLKPSSRKVLNSVFLKEACDAGLDMAIVNLRHIVPLAELSEADIRISQNLIYNKLDESDHAPSGSTPLFQFISHFDSQEQSISIQEQETEMDLPLDQKIQKKIIKGSKTGMEDLLTSVLESSSAIQIINSMLIPAMKVVGELFGEGKMQLPFVLQSAEVMKYSVDFLEPFMEKKKRSEELSIVLATVRGDVHDIGKNLVDIILSNNGFRVYNLGIKCEIDAIIQKAEENKVDAIGMSGLLVKSTVVMRDNLIALQQKQIGIPVLLGGAALTPSYVWDDCSSVIESPVLYCADAFAGLEAMNSLKEGNFDTYYAKLRSQAKKSAVSVSRKTLSSTEEIAIEELQTIPRPPFWGIKVVENIDIDLVYPFLTEEVLFRGRWGYRRGKLSKEEYDALIRETVRPEFELLKKECRNILKPCVSYGYFRCNSLGEDLIMYEDEREIARFTFPRQSSSPKQCIADYFLPLSSGRRDIIALQIATVGLQANEHSQALFENAQYKDYLLFHGLSVECAEALAEYWHLRIRQELDITEEDGSGIGDFVVQKYRGSRYSFGYPACPDITQNRILCNLLHSESIDVTISDEDQMFPEQTTSAFIVHHPQAKYFNVH